MRKKSEPAKVPEPKRVRRRPSAVSRVFGWLFVLILIGGVLAGAGAFYAYQEYTLPGPLAENKVFVIEKGLSTQDVAAALEENGIISDAGVFSAMAYVTGTRTRLRAGEYEFPAEATMRDVMAKIASGKSITYKISIPEGWTSEMAVARVNANDVLTGPPAEVPPEGAIMPDTYVFHRGMTRQQLVENMRTAQVALLDSLWEKRSPVLNIDTKEEAVILASIVEKETGVAEERPLIASVFLNRLKKGMRLQSDPTIIYGIVGGKGKLDRKLTRTDIQTPTPYNTYRINGLPPGPIANPGRAAIEAVLNPQSTDFLYFVADGSGGHAFSSTLEEHNKNVKTWRQIAGNAAAVVATEEAPAGEPSAAEADAQGEPPAEETVPPPPVVPPADVVNAVPEPLVPDQAAAGGETPLPGSHLTTDGGQTTAETPPAQNSETSPAPVSDASPAEPAPEAAPAKPVQQTTNAAPQPPAKPEKPAKPAAAPPKPGSVFNDNGRLVAIPKPNPRR